MKPKKQIRRPVTPKLVVADKARPKTASAPAAAKAPVRLHIGKILVPVDFSEHSRKAVRYAFAFARQFDAEVTLVHIIEQIVYPGDWMYPPITMTDFAVEKSDEIMKRLRLLDTGSGVKIGHVVRPGRAWKEVTEIAREEKSDLIILATHGYTGLKHVLLGSVAEKIVRHAPCPVLSVRADERDLL